MFELDDAGIKNFKVFFVLSCILSFVREYSIPYVFASSTAIDRANEELITLLSAIDSHLSKDDFESKVKLRDT